MPGPFPNPNIDPDQTPLVSVSWNDVWTPYIVGQCERLLDESLWDVSADDWPALEGRIHTLLSIIGGVTVPITEHMLYEGDAPFADAIDDATPVNLGMRVQSSTVGDVTGIRLWRRDLDGNGQVGALWTNAGALLASAVSEPDILGWAFCEFETPVAIDPDTTYVISGYFPSGRFVRTFGAMSSPVSNPPLTAIADGVDGDSGVYTYAGALTFPANDGFASNYFIDLILQTTA
jgi:hypothetical protein